MFATFTRTVLLGAAALALVSACGTGPTTPTSLSGIAPEHVAADTAFATMMVPHHRQAVSMSAPAATRAGSPEVRTLAARIQQEQSPEIDRMGAMLTAWGEPPAPATMAGGTGMGMMSDADMSRLAGESGPAFDRDFLTMMIGHHTGAVTMARAELDQGRNPQARELAQSIVDGQQAEIREMQGLLGRV